MRAVVTLLETAVRFPTLSLPIGAWLRVARQRRELARLDKRALADIGLEPHEAYAESQRPFWDLPRRETR